MTYKIEAKNVSVHYKGFKALNDLSFTMEGKKIIGVIGRNGAGKTTLLSVLGAYRDSTVGYISANDELIFENSNYMQDISLMYDAPIKDHEDQTIKNAIKMLKIYRPNFDEAYAMKLLERFNLSIKKKLSKLSKGQLAAYNVTIGLASRTPITIFDEVYLGMDAPTRSMFYKELLNEQELHPRLFILSTHLVTEMEHLFDEVMIIHEGQLLLHDGYESVTEKGMVLTGRSDLIDEFTSSFDVLNEEQLGGTKAALIYGDLSETEQKQARECGIEVKPASLQDIFTHLTGGER